MEHQTSGKRGKHRAAAVAAGLLLVGLAGCSVRFRTGEAAAPQDGAAKQEAEDGEDKKKIKPYGEVVTEETVSDSGLFVVHRVDEKLLFEIPDSMLGREMLLVSRRARTAQRLGFGGMKNNTQTIRWQRHQDRILLRVTSHEIVADDSLPIYEAVINATFEPIVKTFDIEAISEDSSAVVIDVTKLYKGDVPMLGLSRPLRERFKVTTLDEARSFVEWARSFPRNIEVRVILTYSASQPPANLSTGTLSLEFSNVLGKPWIDNISDVRRVEP